MINLTIRTTPDTTISALDEAFEAALTRMKNVLREEESFTTLGEREWVVFLNVDRGLHSARLSTYCVHEDDLPLGTPRDLIIGEADIEIASVEDWCPVDEMGLAELEGEELGCLFQNREMAYCPEGKFCERLCAHTCRGFLEGSSGCGYETCKVGAKNVLESAGYSRNL